MARIWSPFGLLALAVMTGCGGDGSAGGDPLDEGPTAPAPTMIQAWVGPDPSFVQVGGSTYFQALGEYSDGVVRNLKVAWDSSDYGIATVTSAGLATGVGPGSALIIATSIDDPAASWSATLVVSLTPVDVPTITTLTIPSARVGTAYSQALLYSGGTGAPAWSIVSGNLPTGLSLDPTTGVISGTPTSIYGGVLMSVTVYDPVTCSSVVITVGSFTFTVRLQTGPDPSSSDLQLLRLSVYPP